MQLIGNITGTGKTTVSWSWVTQVQVLFPNSKPEASGNTNLALAVFGCLWESLIVFAHDWVHFWSLKFFRELKGHILDLWKQKIYVYLIL